MHRLRLNRGELGLPALLPDPLRSIHQRTCDAAQSRVGSFVGAKLQRSLGMVLQVRVLYRQSGALPVQEPGPSGQV